MTAALVALGLALVVLAVGDLAWTALAAGSGAGPLTARVATTVWSAANTGSRRGLGHRVLIVAGVAVVLSMVATWVALAYGGWVLVFASTDGAVVATTTEEPASLVERIYFVGYTVFTLGNGEYKPGNGWWQMATIATTGNGLVLLTLAITYLGPVVSAVSDRRQLATSINSLGTSPQDVVCEAWNGSGFEALPLHLAAVSTSLSQASQQHLAYPVLHFFHSPEPETAAAPQLVKLHDALLLLTGGVAPEVRLAAIATAPVRRALDAYLLTLSRAFIGPLKEPTPAPTLEPLRAAGIPTVDDDEWRSFVGDHLDQRRLLAGLLEDDGWLPGGQP